ncbi:hypothetical protein [Glutamicibacter soli]
MIRLSIFALGLFALSGALQNPSYGAEISAVKLVPCQEKKTMGEREAQIKWKLCPEGKKKVPRNYVLLDHDSKGGTPKIEIRDFDSCRPTYENIMGCDSNPDVRACADGSFPIVRQIVGKEGEQEGAVLLTYSVCPEDPERVDLPEGKIVEEIRVSPEQFRSFPIKASKISSDPNSFSLRNANTHLWASTSEQTFNVAIGSSKVNIKAIPIQWNWSYGDGTTRNLNFPGKPEPNHTLHDKTATSHIYEETGKFSVGVTTLYRGEFSVDGGPWQSIPGQAAIPSTPITMDVWRTKKELIANE